MVDLGDVLGVGIEVVGWVVEAGVSLPGGGSEGAAPAAAIVPSLRGLSRERLEARALDRHAPDAERLAALAALTGDPALDPARVILDLLRDPSIEVRTAAIRIAGARRVPGAFRRLAYLGGRSPEEEAAIATALAKTGGAEAEPRLLFFLEHGQAPAQLAAAKALARVGTLGSVDALCAHRDGWFSGELGTEAAAAIKAIQGRLARSAPGGLSLSLGGLRGDLSFAPPEGALSESDA